MNKDELKAKLEAQRKWREESPTPARPKGRISIVQLVLTFFWTAGFLYAGWALTPYLSPRDTAPASITTTPSVEASPTVELVVMQGNLRMTVCAGGFEGAKLHVRFEAGMNGAVRGYLTEGETVTVPLGEQDEPITKLMDDTRWVFIQSPIIGWVSASRLCK